LFKLGIDEERGGEFRSNISRCSFCAQDILFADLIILDEASMLNKAQSIGGEFRTPELPAAELDQIDFQKVDLQTAMPS
jgi:hypothetical protein